MVVVATWGSGGGAGGPGDGVRGGLVERCGGTFGCGRTSCGGGGRGGPGLLEKAVTDVERDGLVGPELVQVERDGADLGWWFE